MGVRVSPARSVCDPVDKRTTISGVDCACSPLSGTPPAPPPLTPAPMPSSDRETTESNSPTSAFRDPRLHRADARLDLALAVAVSMIDPLGASFVKTGSAALLRLQLHQSLQDVLPLSKKISVGVLLSSQRVPVASFWCRPSWCPQVAWSCGNNQFTKTPWWPLSLRELHHVLGHHPPLTCAIASAMVACPLYAGWQFLDLSWR